MTESVPATATKQCPFCAETIQAAAIVCRYCGRDLPTAPTQPRVVQQGQGYACSVCGGALRADAVFCKHCYAKFVSTPAVPAEAPKPGGISQRATALIILALLVVGVAVLVLVGGKPSGSSSQSFQPDPIGAWVDCKNFVTKGLKSPATAEFPLSNDPGVSITQASGRWSVRGFVDAENAFGAKLRNQFSCEMTYSGSQVTIHKLTIGDQTLIND